MAEKKTTKTIESMAVHLCTSKFLPTFAVPNATLKISWALFECGYIVNLFLLKVKVFVKTTPKKMEISELHDFQQNQRNL
jgi:hypothetical protein